MLSGRPFAPSLLELVRMIGDVTGGDIRLRRTNGSCGTVGGFDCSSAAMDRAGRTSVDTDASSSSARSGWPGPSGLANCIGLLNSIIVCVCGLTNCVCVGLGVTVS